MNLRKDHYRVGVPLFGPDLQTFVYHAYTVALAGDIDALPEPQPKSILLCLSWNIKKLFKTFNNGSLGSRIDEERSEMR